MKLPNSKACPNLNTIVGAAKILIDHGYFKWSKEDGFDFDRHAQSKVETWLRKMVSEEKLMTGNWHKKTWVGFAVLSRLVRAYLQRAIDVGTPNWDVVVAKVLAIVLVASLGARAGDVARARGYVGLEYMRYAHIRLWLNGPEPEFANLEGEVTIQYSKGHKKDLNSDNIRRIAPLNHRTNTHVCPVAWLLIHCLRQGLVHGTTLEELLQHTASRPDRVIEWRFPDRPVLSAFTSGPYRCDLDAPAGVELLHQTMREMGLVAGMRNRVYTHALRLGFARAVAHLPASVTDGTANATSGAARSLGHTSSSFQRGVTDAYVGSTSLMA